MCVGHDEVKGITDKLKVKACALEEEVSATYAMIIMIAEENCENERQFMHAIYCVKKMSDISWENRSAS